jgi:sulfur carrier protein
MKLRLNGELAEYAEVTTVVDLISQLGLAPETTLVEHNGVALHRRTWPNEKLSEGDRVEVLRVAAGG